MSDTVPFSDSASEDTKLQNVTNDYCYSEPIIDLVVASKVYQISQSRLTSRSSFFRGIFALPQSDQVVDRTALQVDAGELEWRAFLWFIHADPLAAVIFLTSPACVEKCVRYLGIAVVAHRYDAMDVAGWAIGEALKMLKQPYRAFQVDMDIARLLICAASRWRQDSAVSDDCRDILCDAFHPAQAGTLSHDPISALELVREDQFVLAHTYFYVLCKGYGYDWKNDPRVKSVDRQRLLCGTRALAPELVGNNWLPQRPVPRPSVRSIAVRLSGAISLFLSFCFYYLVHLVLAALGYGVFFAPPVWYHRLALATRSDLSVHALSPPALHARSSDAHGSQAAVLWQPEIDWRIKRRRNELWECFDEQQWALGT
ncbi:hypothetical protein AURDEDRAFT_188523 [Auricularia subglabra TFB-10046 SS5]|uniref:BTB domain-containing protein n=1 Tax=Auricularia subglabra (strain TFB-10046 / SS5) TaxID=717982 RepID=J0CY33_AURST|nr:hypothetical protein AURDEDRAFT_188523 [Auricularia subglabra TFB-10046 SS5]